MLLQKMLCFNMNSERRYPATPPDQVKSIIEAIKNFIFSFRFFDFFLESYMYQTGKNTTLRNVCSAESTLTGASS